ncbi:TPA: putative phage tail assembly chaperone [Vibrio parahaemolyticus]|nr:putative phage tail assembly chaperone [Vibrio alginolyticus]HCE5112907.1 putative phage tail assembly chaperone [Vibrio parahaemolyticus]HCE5127313.1 putative phage tail assembly chaperone [Vibrio parahaemolyticus]HCE5189005.1 putative phage tail assembly chaperone [Vibrio parahaemolyticus]HCG6506106.1 putative phage tail assembly chaperone [Vibrio parahaemolyticus]
MKTIVLTIGDDLELHFAPTEAEYSDYMSELAKGEIVNSAHNFLMSTVTDESKDDFRDLTKGNPGAALQIVGEVLKEYTPKLQIKVKK